MSDKMLGDIREYITKIMADWRVPGLAVAVVKDGEMMLSEGFGLRDIEKGLPVTPDTLMAIGSCSKAFTATAIAMLVDEGILEWDRPVRHYLPTFKMCDSFANERITPRDMLCHRCGLPGHDFLWYHSPLSRKELVERIQYLEPSYNFRSVWQYQNLIFMAAGYLVGQMSNSTWEEFVQKRIFEPLGMKTSNFSVDDSQNAADFSQPYELKDGKISLMKFAKIDNIGPAGSINSSVNEMARWVLLQLNKGKHGDKQLVSEANMEQIHTPQMVILDPVRNRIYQTDIMTYGLGWVVHYQRGHKLVWHSGGIDGFIANVSFMPDVNAGVVVLSNLNVNRIVPAITFSIYDRLLGLDPIDWSERFRQVGEEMDKEEREADEKLTKARVSGTSPSHSLADYTGEFENPGYGVITVQQDGTSLTQTFNGLTNTMKHYHYDTFETIFEIEMRRHRKTMTYATDAKGKVVSFAVPFEPLLAPIEFKRKEI